MKVFRTKFVEKIKKNIFIQ